MRSRLQPVVLPLEVGDFSADLGQIFRELERSLGQEPLSGECSPALDVYESDTALEVAMDLPGVDPRAVRVLVKGGVMLIAGEKPPKRGRGDSSFHLVERGFGRFARTVRLTVACDVAHARATLSAGELRVTFPKIAERRGRSISIEISGDRPTA
jgi:HSP20 family protein